MALDGVGKACVVGADDDDDDDVEDQSLVVDELFAVDTDVTLEPTLTAHLTQLLTIRALHRTIAHAWNIQTIISISH